MQYKIMSLVLVMLWGGAMVASNRSATDPQTRPAAVSLLSEADLAKLRLIQGTVVASNPPAKAQTPAVSEISSTDLEQLRLILKRALLNELEKRKKNDYRNALNWQKQIDAIQRAEDCGPEVSLDLVYTVFPEVCEKFPTALAVKQALLALNEINLYGTVYGVYIFTITGARQPIKRLSMGPTPSTTGSHMRIESNDVPNNIQIKSIIWDRSGTKLMLMDNSDNSIAELTMVEAPAPKSPK